MEIKFRNGSSIKTNTYKGMRFLSAFEGECGYIEPRLWERLRPKILSEQGTGDHKGKPIITSFLPGYKEIPT